VIQATSDYQREWQFRRKDGTGFPAEVIATKMPDGNLLGMIRDITESDAEFILELLNTPKFKKYIGDRGVRTVDDARDFIETRYRKSYTEHGYGLYLVQIYIPQSRSLHLSMKEIAEVLIENKPIGMCGFVKRDYFEFPDIGFAFLPEYEGQGYGFESAKAVLDHGRDELGFTKVLAITSRDNEVSGRLLEKLGFRFDRLYQNPEGEELKLFEKSL